MHLHILNGKWIVLVSAACVFVMLLIWQLPFLLIFVLAVVLAGLTLTMVNVGAVVWSLFIIRPSLDIFLDYTIPFLIFDISINVASVTALIFLLASSLFLVLYLPLRVPLKWAFGVFLGMAVGGIAFGDQLGGGVTETVRLVTFFMAFVVIFAGIRYVNDFYRFLWVVFFSSVIPALVGTFEYITEQGIYTNPGFDNRIMATFGHPNVFAYFLVIVLAVMMILWLMRRSSWSSVQRWLFTGYGMVLIGLLLATYTRGAWIAAFLILGGAAFIYARKWCLTGVVVAASVGVMALTVSSMLQLYTAAELPSFENVPVYDRITDMFEGKLSDSILWRLQMWRDMWNVGWDSPFVGAGTGHIKSAVEDVRGVQLGSLEVHNDYIRVFVEWGLVGLAGYLFFVGSVIAAVMSRMRRSREAVFVVLLLLVIGLYLASGWDNILRQTANMWLFFGLLGASLKWFELEYGDNF